MVNLVRRRVPMEQDISVLQMNDLINDLMRSFWRVFSLVLPSLWNNSGVVKFLPKVVKDFEENEIKFVCLPPNSTHITLDVAFIKYLKQLGVI